MAARSAAGVSPVRTATVSCGRCQTQPLGLGGDPLQRGPQVLLDVDGERPEGRDVDDARTPGRRVLRTVGDGLPDWAR